MQRSTFNISFFDMKAAKRNYDSTACHVIGYARLSFDEDGDNFVSIENQKSILDDFYLQHYQTESSTYEFIADDNVSGYKFERDGLYHLMELIEEGKCNIIIAKDLSRIGRHGALTQLFIEQCEAVGIRIHAMSDYDSTKESDDLILGIRAWSNERVVKDTSAKIKKIVKHKQSNGTWFCAAPFGYYVIDYQKGKVGILEEAASIVRRIFDMYLSGMGVNAIARTLTREHVPTPNMFLRELALSKGDDFKKRISANWQAAGISTILSNEFYVGTLITGRYKRDGINGPDMRTSSSAWQKFENHHEPIISKETFLAAQEIKKNNQRYNTRRKNDREHLLHGIVFCGECGSVEYAYAPKGLDTQYVCSKHFKYGKTACTRHRVKESLLISIAIDFLKLTRETCRDTIDSLDNDLFIKRSAKDDAQAIDDMMKQIGHLDAQLVIIEEQRIKQILAHPDREDSINTIYDKMASDTVSQRNTLNDRVAVMKKTMADASDSIKKVRRAIDIIDKVIESGTLDRASLLSIFDRITVYEGGTIDIQLKPYLKILDPQNYSISIKPHKQPEETYTINCSPQKLNETCEGDPSTNTLNFLSSFVEAITTLSSSLQRCAS